MGKFDPLDNSPVIGCCLDSLVHEEISLLESVQEELVGDPALMKVSSKGPAVLPTTFVTPGASVGEGQLRHCIGACLILVDELIQRFMTLEIYHGILSFPRGVTSFFKFDSGKCDEYA